MAAALAAVSIGAPVERDCVGAAPGCRPLPGGSLAGVSSLALSADGKSLYASAYGAGSLLTFRRDQAGKPQFAGAGGPLAGAAGIAVSPGGADVYVAAGLGRSLTRFSRSSGGELTFGACTADDGRHGCEDPPMDALAGASAVAVSPDGEDLYVTASESGAVSHLRRRADGSLRLSSCIADAGNFGCARTPRNVLEGAAAIAIAPGGRDVYVTALRSGSLTRFTRTSTGALRYRSCIADGGANGCRKTSATLTAAAGLAISPDGLRVVVAAQIGVVSAYDRGLHRIARVRRASLAGATGIATNGRDVYVAGQRGDAITRLTRGLRFVARTLLEGVYGLALRGHTLYAAAPDAATLTTFRVP